MLITSHNTDLNKFTVFILDLLWSGQIYITFMHFSRRFYPKELTVHSGYTFFVSMCVPWER